MAGKRAIISDLRIYPIKSCRGISLPSALLTRQGLQYDRTWMFVSASPSSPSKSAKFITIRDKSELTLIRTAIDTTTQSLNITFPAIKEAGLNEKTISVPLEPSEEYLASHCETIDVEIWKYETDAYTYTDSEIKSAVSDFFEAINRNPAEAAAKTNDEEKDVGGSKVKLVMKGPTPRKARGNGAPDILGRMETVNFPDVLPILVASESSLEELNSRLESRNESPITIERFRPNVILASSSSGHDEEDENGKLVPWEEDEWRTLLFNPPPPTTGRSILSSVLPHSYNPTFPSSSIVVDVSARCARCQVPNVDPDTGTKHAKEPWSVLYSYRRVDEGIKVKPCFGMLCCPRSEGPLERGMSVEVLDVMEPAGGKGRHLYIKGF